MLKRIQLLAFILLAVLLSIQTMQAQIITKWEYIDSTDLNYFSWHSANFIITNHICAGIDENDFVVCGYRALNNDMPNAMRGTYIKQYTKRGTENKIVYADTIHTSDHVISIAHPSANLIIAVGDINESGSSFHTGLIIKSTDAGLTWNRMLTDSNVSYRMISMCNAKDGIIMKANHTNLYNNQRKDGLPYNTLLKTEDNWETNKEIILLDVSYIDNIQCLAPKNYIILAHNANYYFVITKDGGETWTRSKNFDKIITLKSFKFVNDRIGIAVGSRADVKPVPGSRDTLCIFKTVDGGSNWVEIRNITRWYDIMIYNNSKIDFADSLNGVIGSYYNTLLRTTDGGNSWFQEFFPFRPRSAELINSINMMSAESIYFPKKDISFCVLDSKSIIRNEGKLALYPPHFIPFEHDLSLNQDINNVNLQWTESKGASRYRLKLAEINDFNNPEIDTIVADTSIYLSGLKNSASYMGWVKAIADTIESDWSESTAFVFITRPRDGILYYPHVISPKPNSYNLPLSFDITWSNVIGSTSYGLSLYKRIGEYSGSPKLYLIVSDTNIVGNTYHADSLLPNTGYYVCLRAKSAVATSAYSSGVLLTTGLGTGIDDQPAIIKDDNQLRIYPNPSKKEIIISYTAEGNGPLSIVLYDLSGAEVLRRVYDPIIDNTVHEIKLNTAGLSAGAYYCIIKQNGKSQSGLMIKE